MAGSEPWLSLLLHLPSQSCTWLSLVLWEYPLASAALWVLSTSRVYVADLSIHVLLTPHTFNLEVTQFPLNVLPYQRAAGSQSLLRLHPSYPPGGLWPYGPFVPWLCCYHQWLDFPRDPAGSPVIQYWLALSRGLSRCLLSTQLSSHRQVFSWKR